MISRLSFSADQYREMLEHVSQQAPLEACGLLAGRDARVEKVIPVRNQAESPVRFVMDPYEQLQAFEWIDLHSLELLGIFHSHPAGPQTVSATDIGEAAYAVVHLIWSRSGDAWNVRGFWIEQGQVQEVTLSLEE
ncbi:MAG TPA: M67 family metallopeptidase [Anaerolineales bacterium]|nr:M67 family metallopeptidase [Anaerolineales bacterium]